MARILFFGRLGDAFGRERDVELPDGCIVAALRELIAEAVPSAGGMLRHPSVKVCVDRAIVGDGAVLRAGQEIAFLPPLSGG